MFPDFKSEDELTFVLGDSSADKVVERLREKKALTSIINYFLTLSLSILVSDPVIILFSNFQVACVPVLDPVRKTDHEPRVEGLVDVADIATYVFGLDKNQPVYFVLPFSES